MVKLTKGEALTVALVEAIREFRGRAAMVGVKHLTIGIDTEGRVDGDWKITYQVGERYQSNSVSGNTLDDVFKEFLRRRGWNESHQPLCLPNVDGGDVAGDFVEGRA